MKIINDTHGLNTALGLPQGTSTYFTLPHTAKYVQCLIKHYKDYSVYKIIKGPKKDNIINIGFYWWKERITNGHVYLK